MWTMSWALSSSRRERMSVSSALMFRSVLSVGFSVEDSAPAGPSCAVGAGSLRSGMLLIGFAQSLP
ncbi:hypothetical protein DMC18_07835 [Caulobacter sp. D5]|nr:hypothetical protein DMC18_07835 [Caulobacter sp. D5]